MAWAICVGTVHILSSYFVKWNKSTGETTCLLLSNWAQIKDTRQKDPNLHFLETFCELWLLLYIHVYLILVPFILFCSIWWQSKMDIVTILGWLVLLFPQLLKLKFLWWEIWNGHLYLHVYGDTLATRDIVVYFRL